MKKSIIIFLAILLCAPLLCSPARAQEIPAANGNQPLEITADETLEWHRADHQYIARGNVVAKQGDVEIRADVLTADYRETASSSFDIYRLSADGNVAISSQGNVAKGDKAVYDVAAGHAVITGQKLTLTSPDQTVTARDSFEYSVTDGRLSASGDAYVVRGGDTMRADTVAAIFAQDAAGQRKLKELTADGNVIITTPDETLRGANGRYNAGTDIAELTGSVKIERGPNVLEGERAEVNLTTNVSKMTGSPAQGGRVRGVFYPGSATAPKK